MRCTTILLVLVIVLCQGSPIKRTAHDKVENTCYGKHCTVNINYPAPNSFTPKFAENVTDIVPSVLSIAEVQDQITSLLQNQTKNQVTSQEQIVDLLHSYQESWIQQLQNQQLNQNGLMDLIESLHDSQALSLIMTNNSIEVIQVDNMTRSALLTLPEIAESQKQILATLQKQTVNMAALVNVTTTLLQNQPKLPDASLSQPLPPTDCKDILLQRYSISKVYTIKPWIDGKSYSVYCDMETDGGGWTVIQRRFNGSVDFYRGWEDYVYGFGDLDGEHWAGLDLLYQLTRSRNVQLKIQLEDFGGIKTTYNYHHFRIGSETSSFTLSEKLSFNEHQSAEPDVLKFMKDMPFSTKDHDSYVDSNNQGCPQEYHGAWWYPRCKYSSDKVYSNLNGQYLNQHQYNKTGMFRSSTYYRYYKTLTKSMMKIRPV